MGSFVAGHCILVGDEIPELEWGTDPYGNQTLVVLIAVSESVYNTIGQLEALVGCKYQLVS